jgi:hypothetical protein
MLVLSTTDSFGQSSDGRQSASLPYLNAQVAIEYTPSRKAIAEFTFSTNDRAKENVNCLNAYRDIKYILRSTSGAIIKADSNAWTKRPDTMTEQYSEHPCEQLPWRSKDSRAFLETLFPGAPHGQYTLYMTLAPRGRSQTAGFHPVTITL